MTVGGFRSASAGGAVGATGGAACDEGGAVWTIAAVGPASAANTNNEVVRVLAGIMSRIVWVFSGGAPRERRTPRRRTQSLRCVYHRTDEDGLIGEVVLAGAIARRHDHDAKVHECAHIAIEDGGVH